MTWWRTDHAGQVPEVGDYVAYNYSGQIATGWITSKSKDGVRFTIQQRLPKDGHISRVRGGAKCILVLEKGNT